MIERMVVVLLELGNAIDDTPRLCLTCDEIERSIVAMKSLLLLLTAAFPCCFAFRNYFYVKFDSWSPRRAFRNSTQIRASLMQLAKKQNCTVIMIGFK